MGLYPPIVSSNPPVVTRRYNSVEWFVDGENGSDSGARPGNRPEKPLLTIAEANARCVSGEQNIINLIAPGHVTETNPVVIDKQFTTVRGWPGQGSIDAQSPMTCVATVDAPYFDISAQDVVIRDMTIHGGASYPTIVYAEVPWSFRTGVHNITFKAGTWGIQQGDETTGYRVDSPSHGWFITNCKFLPTLSVGGILLASNGSWGLIADNFFESAPLGIYGHINCQSTANQILRNRFMLPADTVEGNAITLTNSTRSIVADNMANDASTTGAASNPYLDTANNNMWVRNVVGAAGFTDQAPA